VREATLAPEQIAAEFLLELNDRSAQRGLCDVALLRGLRETERSRHRQEVPDLVHLHEGLRDAYQEINKGSR
jgi:hypothetical protein